MSEDRTLAVFPFERQDPAFLVPAAVILALAAACGAMAGTAIGHLIGALQ